MTARDFRDRLNAAKAGTKGKTPEEQETKLQQVKSQLRSEAIDSIAKNGDTVSRHLAKEIIESLN